jgi:hypothetical protein
LSTIYLGVSEPSGLGSGGGGERVVEPVIVDQVIVLTSQAAPDARREVDHFGAGRR